MKLDTAFVDEWHVQLKFTYFCVIFDLSSVVTECWAGKVTKAISYVLHLPYLYFVLGY